MKLITEAECSDLKRILNLPADARKVLIMAIKGNSSCNWGPSYVVSFARKTSSDRYVNGFLLQYSKHTKLYGYVEKSLRIEAIHLVYTSSRGFECALLRSRNN